MHNIEDRPQMDVSRYAPVSLYTICDTDKKEF